MIDNYPPGAARDPRAPYNQPMETEVEVVATATLQCSTELLIETEHYALSDGGYEIPDSDLQEYFENVNLTPQEILIKCLKIVNALIKANHCTFAGVHLVSMRIALQDWSQEELRVEQV